MVTEGYKFFDPDKFAEQTLGEPIVQKEVKITFLDKTPQILDTIREKAKEKNGVELEKLLHKLKASVSILCLPPMREEVLYLEAHAGEITSDGYASRLNQMLVDLDILMSELDSFEIEEEDE